MPQPQPPHEDVFPDDRICKSCVRGQHIELTCRNHPNLKWSTKNIGYIGARTVFYNLHNDPNMGPECPCDIKELYHPEH